MRTRTGGRLLALLVVLGAAAAVAAALAVRAVLDVTPLWVLVSVAGVEAGAAGSAALDWRDARLQIATKRRAWLVGHITLVQRLARRTRWHATTLQLLAPARPDRPARTTSAPVSATTVETGADVYEQAS